MVKELDMDEVDYVFGAHLASDLPVGKIGIGAGDRMAAVDKFAITITGKGGHGASPHEANDPMVIVSDVVNALQKMVSRRTNPLESAVVTIGVFRSGNAFNVIPNEALLEGTVRTFNETIRYEVKQHIYDLVEGIVQGYRADVDIDYVHGYPALINPEEEVNVLKAIIDKEKIVDMGVSMGAEDFSYFLLEKPGSYFRVGSRNDDEATHYPHHHPRFDIDERALIEAQKVFVKIVSHYLCSNK